MGIGCGKSPPPIKARDIFASVDDLIPFAFTGTRLHLMKHFGELRSSFDPDQQPPMYATDDDDAKCRWSLAPSLRFNAGGLEPGNIWLSTQFKIWSPTAGCTFTAADLDPLSGNWKFEAMSRSNDGQVDASVVAQVCAWMKPRSIQINVDESIPGKTASLSVDPILEKCSFGYIQVSLRLVVGIII